MSKQHKIRWRDADEKELKRVIKNYNAKLKRVIEKDPDNAEIMPEKLSVKLVKSNITTRAEFKEFIASAQRFTQRNAEKIVTNSYGEKATIYAIEETKRNIKKVNEQRKKEREKLDKMPVRIDGKEVKDVVRMAKKKSLKDIDYDFEKSKPGEFKSFARYVEIQNSANANDVRQKQYFENFIKSWHNKFSKANAEYLEKKLRALGYRQLHNLYMQGFEEADIFFNYDIGISEDTKVERIARMIDNA